MSTSETPDEFYRKLLAQLEDTTTFPHIYLYKFIVPTCNNKVEEVVKNFDNLGATINTKQSKNGKYTSISIHVKMKSASAVIDKYKAVSTVKGIISL